VSAEPDPPKVARVLLADDHGLVREGIRGMLAGEEDLDVVGEAADGREALELCRSLAPDLVLMDVRMPVLDGLAATREIKEQQPRTGIVMVTMHEDQDYLFEALRAGAAGYVLKGSTKKELLETVRKVIGGESLIDPALATRLLRRMASADSEDEGRSPSAQTPEPLPESLTPREVEVLKLLAQGQTNPEIARELVVSPATVKAHVHRIILKLGVSDRTQAAVRAVRLGLLPLAD
jgi:DNA-binding NarL/FixJ family response regulator